jgi:hypothetical protein
MSTSKLARKRKGCWVCGARFIRDHSLPTAARNTCSGCLAGRNLVGAYLVVDGAFMSHDGERDTPGPGRGGAGLVLVGDAGEIVATLVCRFEALHSADAEHQAVVRGARWVPHVPIYTDSQSHAEMRRGELGRDVRYLEPWAARHTGSPTF